MTLRRAPGEPSPECHDWDVWRLDPSNYTLVCGSWQRYYVDLERCTTSAECLDWIVQISHKLWATPRLMLGLLHALDDVLHLQATLCSSGQSKRLTKARIRQLALAFADDHPALLSAQAMLTDDEQGFA